MEAIGDAGPGGPGTWGIPVLPRWAWTCCPSIVPRDTYPPSSALPLSPRLCPPSPPQPVPALSPLPLPPRTLDLFTSTPRALRLSIGGSGSTSRRSRASRCRRAAPLTPAALVHLLAGIQQDAQTNKLRYRPRATLQKEMTTGCYCLTFPNNERVFLENICHLIPSALQTRTTGG